MRYTARGGYTVRAQTMYLPRAMYLDVGVIFSAASSSGMLDMHAIHQLNQNHVRQPQFFTRKGEAYQVTLAVYAYIVCRGRK